MDQQKPLKLLILEDVPEDAELVARTLKQAGVAVEMQRVADKEAFSKALDELQPDVILSDFALPHFTGIEAFALAQQRGMTVPFLLVTGALPEAAVLEIIKAGIDDYILKDNLQRLPNAIQNAYAKKSAERRNIQLNELRKKFVGIMSHQLRTPLTVVRWHLEHLLSGELGHIPATQEGILREAYEANQKLVSRIDDLLTVIEIEEGRVLLNKQRVSLESLWKSVMVSIQKDCKIKGVTCNYKTPGAPLYILADTEKLRHGLTKLVENAVVYTPPKGTITINLKVEKDKARLEVTDTGIGIPKSDQPSIFTAFYRASNASVVLPDASGVGLAIAKYFIEQHNGQIGFTSQEGQGSTFWVELPLV